jgi:hypothetical protein
MEYTLPELCSELNNLIGGTADPSNSNQISEEDWKRATETCYGPATTLAKPKAETFRQQYRYLKTEPDFQEDLRLDSLLAAKVRTPGLNSGQLPLKPYTKYTQIVLSALDTGNQAALLALVDFSQPDDESFFSNCLPYILTREAATRGAWYQVD